MCTIRPLIRLSYIDSVERDYKSNTDEFFVEAGHVRRLDDVDARLAPTAATASARTTAPPSFPSSPGWGMRKATSYDVGLSQILTKNLIAGAERRGDHGRRLSWPTPIDRYATLIRSNPKGYSLASQVYPDTRTSTAVQAQAKYYLPYRAAVTGSYRYFSDTWGIVGNTYELDYTHPIANIWILEGRVRYYKQNSATFYSDLFPCRQLPEFRGARPELGGLGQYDDRRESHLRVPARRLENFQASDRHLRHQPHFASTISIFATSSTTACRSTCRARSRCTNSTPRSIRSICRCSSDRN